jgi:ATP-dependent Clp endopeptidase proteolytic subunit ClpP
MWWQRTRIANGPPAALRRPAPEGRDDWVRVRVENRASGGTAEIYIYDEIGYWGTTAQDFVDELAELEVDLIELHVNSPGGDAFDGLAIYNALLEHDASVHVLVDGLAASAASFIAQAGDRVTMAANSQMMIHDAFGVCVGTAADMEQMRGVLDRISRNLASIYAARSGEGTVEDWRDAMRAESWYSADEAVEAGLADDVAPKARSKRRGSVDDDSGAEARHDLSVFKHAGRAEAPAPTIRPATRHAPGAGDTVPVGGPGSGGDETPGSGTGESGPAGDGTADATAADGTLDPFADVDDAVFAGIAAALADVFEPFELDPDVVRTSITDHAENAPATPAVTPRVAAEAPDHIDLETFGNALWEALQ